MTTQYPKFKIKKTKLGKYPYVSVISSTTLALFVIGIFSAIIIYSKELEKIVRNGIEVQVFIQNHISASERKEIRNMLAAKYFTADENAIRFISKEKAAEDLKHETGEDFVQLIGENPLYDAFIVKIAADYQDKKSLAIIKNDIEKMQGVFQVHYIENMIESINKNITRVSLILLGTGGLLFFIAILLINNAVKLALFSQRFIIRSMQLVGATPWFIQRSFLYRALVNGGAAGVFSSLLIFGLISLGNRQIEGLQIIYNSHKILLLFFILLVLGILVSSLSTLRVVNNFLKLSLDELH